MICPVPEIGIEMAEEPARGGLPCPPQVEAHLAQRFERRRQDGSYVICLKSRHASLHGNRAAVNRENLLRQVAEPISSASERGTTRTKRPIRARSDGVGERSFPSLAPAEVGGDSYTSRREDESEKEAGDQSAQVRGHANLWCRKIEGDLNHYDHYDVS